MKKTKAKLARAAWRDAIIIFGISAALLAYFISVEAFEYVVEFSDSHESWELDEILTLLMVLPAALAIFSWRRVKETRSELIARIEAENRAQQMALHDPLTGLPNRRHIKQEIDKLLADADRSPVAVMMLDLNRFKATNDLLGHLVGDQLLIGVAERLTEASGPQAVVSRLGGDEFVVLLPDAPKGEALLAKVEQISEAFDKPFELESSIVSAGASIGVTFIDTAGVNSEIALSQADAAMYGCKAKGSNGFRFFEAGMEEASIRRAELETQLAQAIPENQIRPYYQPLVNLSTGEVVGFEVLARWHRDDGEVRMPGEFIPIAEDTGMICELYYSLLRQAAEDVKHWPPELSFSINLSPIQFSDEWLIERTLQILSEAGIAPGRLEIEITENALVKDVEVARKVIEDFKRQRIRVALDDFGTGYSSLRHLNELEFDKLKIDRSFIRDLEFNESSQTIVRTITSLAHNLGLEVTVEGIESTLNADTLIGYGCDLGQGYLYGKPGKATFAHDGKDGYGARKDGAEKVA